MAAFLRFDGAMQQISSDPVLDDSGAVELGSWRDLAAVGDERWALRSAASGPPYPVALDRFDASGARVAWADLPAIGPDGERDSPSFSLVTGVRPGLSGFARDAAGGTWILENEMYSTSHYHHVRLRHLRLPWRTCGFPARHHSGHNRPRRPGPGVLRWICGAGRLRRWRARSS